MAQAAAQLDDAELARAVAHAGGEVLLAVRAEAPAGDTGARGDAMAQARIAAMIRSARPQDATLSEEAADDTARSAADRVWIIDPLDGTREFGEGRADWAVHVALWERGELVAGAVALPALGLVFGTDVPSDLPPPGGGAVRIAVSRTRPAPVVHDVAARIGAELVPMGSAGFKTCSIISGDADAYLHDGGQYEWDSAAPVAVARSAGLHASRLDGTALRYNRRDPYLPDLMVCRPELAPMLLAAVAQGGSSSMSLRSVS